MPQYEPENKRGTRLGRWVIVLFVIMCLGVGYQQLTRKPAVIITNQPEITHQLFLDAAEGNKEAIEDIALAFGVTVEEAYDFAIQAKDQIEEMERLKEREKTLGSWEDAIRTGTLVKTDPVDDDGDIARYYDVTGDGVADFQVYFRDGKPYVWRFADETGEPYG